MKYLKQYNKINESILKDSHDLHYKTWQKFSFDNYCEKVKGVEYYEYYYTLYKTKNDDYFIVDKYDGHIVSYDYIISNYKKDSRCIEVINKLLEPLKTYEFQKEYLNKYPERVGELKQIGYNTELINDPNYSWLLDQESNGFFGLK